MAPFERTTDENSFKWSHYRIPGAAFPFFSKTDMCHPTGWGFRVLSVNRYTITLFSVLNMYMYHHRISSLDSIHLTNKWYHEKVLLKRFLLNGKTIGFHPQTHKLELHTK